MQRIQSESGSLVRHVLRFFVVVFFLEAIKFVTHQVKSVTIFMNIHCLTEFPSANVTPSSVTVNEGEEISLLCEAGGSGALNVSWTMADGSPLPVGVQENGNEIFIARAASYHPGTYVCSVGNLAGTSQDEAIVNVYCECFAELCFQSNYISLH